MSDEVAVYGNLLGRALTERERFGLWLNMDRIMLREATIVSLGIGAAVSKQPLERGWFDAVAMDESEVDELEYRVNAARQDQAVKTRLGFGRR